MNKLLYLLLSTFFLSWNTMAQHKTKREVDQFADMSAGFGSSQVTGSLSYVYNWKIGKRKRWEAGFGVRFTGYFAKDLYFKTAPAKLTSGKTGPGVLFADDIIPNIDSVLFPKAQVNIMNLSLNFGYNISKRFLIGFNIDAIGFSFGGRKPGIYYGNNFATGIAVKARPTGFNLLLISDNDKGSLNSEIFARYKWNSSWAVKLAFQFLFVEYTTDSQVQTTAGGDKNNRFRKKMAGAGIGVIYNLKN